MSVEPGLITSITQIVGTTCSFSPLTLLSACLTDCSTWQVDGEAEESFMEACSDPIGAYDERGVRSFSNRFPMLPHETELLQLMSKGFQSCFAL